MHDEQIKQQYEYAKGRFAVIGVDVDKAMEELDKTEISMHCWQGDDVRGFEENAGEISGGILTTGNYPGRARNAAELRQDVDEAMSLIPGKQRFNLHATYLETDGKLVERNEIVPEYFEGWLNWAQERKISLDFNTTMFGHKYSDDGYTLASYDKKIREFWIEHGRRVRKIAEVFGKKQQNPCVINHWMPDGSKDNNVDKYERRKLLVESLDKVMGEDISEQYVLDSIESKLFGIGVESFTVSSPEFALGYALSRHKLVTYDLGHFHPTENVADKISSTLLFLDKILLHTSRPVRWDSDHVVVQNDDLNNLMKEVIRADALRRVYIALDYFDASINRIAAWVIGTRATQKALLSALLEPLKMLKEEELAGNTTWRLALTEEHNNMPINAVWDYYCMRHDVPVGNAWMDEVKTYEKDVLSKRD